MRVAGKIVVLEEGKIVEQGTHQERVAKGGLYGTVYKTQFEETIGPIKLKGISGLCKNTCNHPCICRKPNMVKISKA